MKQYFPNGYKQTLDNLTENLIKKYQGSYEEIDDSLLKEKAIKAKNGDREALSFLIKHNLKLIAKVVHNLLSQYQLNYDIDTLQDIFEDCFNVGIEGFIYGIQKYDPSKNTKPQTYLWYWIEEKVRLYLYENRIIKVPAGKLKRKYRNEHPEESYPTTVFLEDLVQPDKYGAYNDEICDQIALEQEIRIKYPLERLLYLYRYGLLTINITFKDLKLILKGGGKQCLKSKKFKQQN